jgi:hypothetical protein
VSESRILVGPPAHPPRRGTPGHVLSPPAVPGPDALSRRINAEPEEIERGLAQLVLTIVELLRALMERQALRRVQVGDLTDEEVERLGRTMMLLADRMEELKAQFGLQDSDLNLNLGPLGNLM